MATKVHEMRSMNRQMWLESLPYFKEYAKPDEQLLPPQDDNECCAFVDDVLFWASAKHAPAWKFYPKDRNGDRPVLKRVYKKLAPDGGPNPNYGRFYFTNARPDGLKYFQWLDETVWYKSFQHRRCLNVDWQRLISCTGQPTNVPLWEPLFMKYYNSELSIDAIVAQSMPKADVPNPADQRVLPNGIVLPPVNGTGRAAVEQFNGQRF